MACLFTRRIVLPTLFALACSGGTISAVPAQTDPLPSWNAGAVKKSITDFVARVTTPGTDFLPVSERIATFDNDGTLWCEQPVYFQLTFAFDRLKAMAPQHPEWKTKEPFKSVLNRDIKGLAAAGATPSAGVKTWPSRQAATRSANPR